MGKILSEDHFVGILQKRPHTGRRFPTRRRRPNLSEPSPPDWIHFLNAGSQINISYNVNPPRSSFLVLVIAQGNEGLAQWIEDPSYPNTTLSWNIIHGEISYLCCLIFLFYPNQLLINLSDILLSPIWIKYPPVFVHLNFRIKDFLYNTTGSYYKCTPAHIQCVFSLHFPSENSALLTFPGRKSGMASVGWHIRLSYGPRWIIYIGGLGTICNVAAKIRAEINLELCSLREILSFYKKTVICQAGVRLMTLSHKTISFAKKGGWGVLVEEKPVKDGEYSNNMMRLCAICYDAPRDSFFLPCGHCVACFACATR
ncbi:uncharacterized protein LOC111392552 [Olea europaea var. sylvestris]|uniref:uncharacterized protein LOC111392552 n=1 Tax=Olea europaea var. sylvestris TaxID=158386 RepID=UPI000C1CF41C|nr:uncharacterized protein LOC111392552 [Olea europaea var. sylvestris]